MLLAEQLTITLSGFTSLEGSREGKGRERRKRQGEGPWIGVTIGLKWREDILIKHTRTSCCAVV